MQCEQCGLESAREEGFHPVRQSFRSKKRTLCPACFARKDDGTLFWVFWLHATTGLVGLLFILLAPALSLGPLMLNIFAVLVFSLVATLLHELGHAVAGKAVGIRIFAIEIGKGRLIGEFMRGGFRWQFRALPFGGVAHGAPRNARWYRSRETVFIVGGPFANVLLIGLAWLALRFDTVLESTWLAGFVPAEMMLVVNSGLLLFSLWPHHAQTSYGRVPNDGLLLWQVWRMPGAEVERAPVDYYAGEAMESRRLSRHHQAQQWIEEG